MAVPEEVKKVPRPVNTTVYDACRDGPKRFFVRERIGCKYIKGHNPQPANLHFSGWHTLLSE